MTDRQMLSTEGALTFNEDGTAVVAAERLDDLLAQLGLKTDEVTVRVLAGELGVDGCAFEMRLGQWQLNAPVAIARAVVNGAVLTALLASNGESSIPATVLSVIVPLVFDLDRVELSPSDRAVYADITRNVPDRKLVDDWYEGLAAHVRAEITSLEFRDLIERLEEVGLVESDDLDVVTIDTPPDSTRRRLRLP